MHRQAFAALATALVLLLGAAPLVAEEGQQARRRGGRAADAPPSVQRSPQRARRAAPRSAPARPRAATPAARPPRADAGRAPGAPAARGAVRRAGPPHRTRTAPSDSVRRPTRGAAVVRDRDASAPSPAVRRRAPRPAVADRPSGSGRPGRAVRVRRPASTGTGGVRRPVESDGRRRGPGRVGGQPVGRRPGSDEAVTRAVPRPPAPPRAAPGDRRRNPDDRGYRRGRGPDRRDGRDYRRGPDRRDRRDYRRGYGRRYGRSYRPGYWYGWDYRRGFGYHRQGLRYGLGYASQAHIHYPGYTHGHVYGTHFYAPGFLFGGGYGYGYGASFFNPTDLHTGFLRLKVRPRYAQVFVDGYFVGVVNEFDGVFQRLRLEEGPHQVELVHPEFEPLELDVLIVPGEKVVFEGDLIPLP